MAMVDDLVKSVKIPKLLEIATSENEGSNVCCHDIPIGDGVQWRSVIYVNLLCYSNSFPRTVIKIASQDPYVIVKRFTVEAKFLTNCNQPELETLWKWDIESFWKMYLTENFLVKIEGHDS
ncbi:hypothetical protein LXL04_003341 [Taraxacum kok-saghyz]